MAFFKVTTSEESVKDYTGDGGKWLNKSGIYDVIVKAVLLLMLLLKVQNILTYG